MTIRSDFAIFQNVQILTPLQGRDCLYVKLLSKAKQTVKGSTLGRNVTRWSLLPCRSYALHNSTLNIVDIKDLKTIVIHQSPLSRTSIEMIVLYKIDVSKQVRTTVQLLHYRTYVQELTPDAVRTAARPGRVRSYRYP